MCIKCNVRDEAIGNLTCSLKANGMADKTVMVLVSDNGCRAEDIVGCSFPFTGSMGQHSRGGISSRAIITSSLIPEAIRGSTFEGLAHVTGKYRSVYC